MSEVHATIEIAAPPTEVWELVMNPRRLAEWVTIHRHLGEASTHPPRRGDVMEQTLTLRGVPFQVHWDLAICEPPTHAVWEGRGPARSRTETEYRLTETAGGTRLDYTTDFHVPLGPIGAIASRALVGGLPQREADTSLRNLKRLIEG